MIRLLLEARDAETGEPLDDVALRNEAAVIFMAGHETTANSLAWAWYLLSQAPEVEERLHAELAKTLAGRLPTLDDVPELSYTRAIFEETVRLYPPVPLLARQASRDETIRGRSVPAGSLVIVVPWLLHRHRKFWGKPDHYHPGALSAGERPVSRETRLYSVQRRSPHLRRRRLRSDRSCPVPRHSGSTGPPALGPRCRRRAGLPPDPAARRRFANVRRKPCLNRRVGIRLAGDVDDPPRLVDDVADMPPYDRGRDGTAPDHRGMKHRGGQNGPDEQMLRQAKADPVGYAEFPADRQPDLGRGRAETGENEDGGQGRRPSASTFDSRAIRAARSVVTTKAAKHHNPGR